jgi:eukaryotic-like serine/threonine-protein kinase
VPDIERWTIVERLYHEAVARPVADRPAFLESACAGDATLRHEVESLLANDGASLLEKSALDVAARAMAQQDTPSWVGRTIRNYDILSLVGVGGMGEVYRARDRSLGREVALKVLPHEVSKDPERVKRLEREARTLASLNHPAVATLFGLEEHEGQRFLVMELVPGQTLADRLRHGPLPTRDALDISRQIAEGLEVAHDAGIVHRDLKPANVKVTPDGRVKLLDFGLAKAFETIPSGVEPTVAATEATREGTVLGTPAYMSPEQARGQSVDRRTDIWAFGCCLYECLSGRRPFKGDTVTDTLAAVLDKEPDWGALGDHVPRGATRLLRRCLAKDVRRRLQHIGDARLDLEETEAETGQRAARDRPTFRAFPALVIAAVLIATAGVAFWLGAGRATTMGERAVTRLTLKLDDKTNGDLTLPLAGWDRPFAISPDGQRIVLRARGGGRSQLFLRELSGFETRPLPGTEAARTPFFSPDGQWIGFWRAEDRILRKVSVAGGSPIELAATDVPPAAVWGTDDEILIQADYPRGELWSIPAGGGQPTPIVVADRSNGESISLRGRVPRGDDLLVASFGLGEAWLDMLSRETGKRRHIVRGGNLPASYTRTGHLVYSDADALLAVPLNQRLEPVGKPVPVLTGIDHYFRHSNVALSDNGTLIYIPADRVEESQLVWEDREGGVTPIPGGRGPMTSAALSPDGREAAVNLVEGTKLQVWVLDLARGARRLLVRNGDGAQPLWSRDGKFITYVGMRGDEHAIYRTRADGTGAEESLVRVTRWTTPLDWSPDGRTLLYSEYTKRGDSDIWSYSGSKATPLLAGPFSEESASFSPDGRFIAFAADDGGASHVYIQAFPGPGPRVAVSIDEGSAPRWGADGRQIFYIGSRRRMVVDVNTDPVVRVGAPRPLSERRDLVGKMPDSPDGRRFLSLTSRAQQGPLELRVVLNWFEELERLAPHPPQ